MLALMHITLQMKAKALLTTAEDFAGDVNQVVFNCMHKIKKPLNAPFRRGLKIRVSS
jgi:hypothetical protein